MARAAKKAKTTPVDRLGAGRNRMTAARSVTASRFRKRYRELSSAELSWHDAIKDTAAQLEFLYSQIGQNRETSLALTQLETSVMYGIKSLTGEPPKASDGEVLSAAQIEKILRQVKRIKAD